MTLLPSNALPLRGAVTWGPRADISCIILTEYPPVTVVEKQGMVAKNPLYLPGFRSFTLPDEESALLDRECPHPCRLPVVAGCDCRLGSTRGDQPNDVPYA